MAGMAEVREGMLVPGSDGMKHARQQKGSHKSSTVQICGSQPQPYCRPITTHFSITDPWSRPRRKKRVKSMPTSQGWRDGNRLWWSRNKEQEKLPQGSMIGFTRDK